MLSKLAHLFLFLATYSLISCEIDKSLDKVDSQQIVDDRIAAKLADRAYEHTASIIRFGHRQPESQGHKKSIVYIVDQLKESNWNCVEQKFTATTPIGKINYTNVIARYTNKARTNPWGRNISGVIGAHFDSKILPNFIGADDAASCVGGILAIAEYLHKKHPEVAQELELVFFDGEEAVGSNMEFQVDGLYGSIHYSRAVQACVADKISPYKKKPQFGIILDMIGHKNLRVKIPSDTPKNLFTSYDLARKKLKLERHFGTHTSPILDDHYPMNVIAKIPTIDLIGDFSNHSWWHTSADNLSLISEKSLQMSLHMTLEILSNQL